jgi:hypothetical protein
MLRGSCLSDMSPEECDTDEEKAARDGKVQVYRDAMLKVASGSPFVRSSQFITREGLVGMYKENAETQLAAATARINALVPRETGLDCLGLELYDGQAGRLVLVGGLGDTELTCAGAPGSGSVKASASASVASAITANTPFRYSRTVVACANTAPAGALDGADLKLSANRGGQDVTCVSAKVSAPAAFDDGVAQLLCATQGSGSGGGVDPMVVAGLVGGLLVVFALVMVARRRAQPPSSL